MSYRKIDVDSLDEDRYLEDDEIIAVAAKVTAEGGEVQVANFTNYKLEPPASAADTEKLVEQCAAEVRSIINRNPAEALTKALSFVPAHATPQPLKDRHTQTVMEALTAVKTSDIGDFLKKLSSAQLDVLMKYIYKGMSVPATYNPAILLQWHEKSVDAGGLGSIVRVMTDRRTV